MEEGRNRLQPLRFSSTAPHPDRRTLSSSCGILKVSVISAPKTRCGWEREGASMVDEASQSTNKFRHFWKDGVLFPSPFRVDPPLRCQSIIPTQSMALGHFKLGHPDFGYLSQKWKLQKAWRRRNGENDKMITSIDTWVTWDWWPLSTNSGAALPSKWGSWVPAPTLKLSTEMDHRSAWGKSTISPCIVWSLGPMKNPSQIHPLDSHGWFHSFARCIYKDKPAQWLIWLIQFLPISQFASLQVSAWWCQPEPWALTKPE